MKKVHVVTRLENEEYDKIRDPIKQRFDKRLEITEIPEEAEIIVMDLSHLPKNWLSYFRHHKVSDTEERATPPCLFFDSRPVEAALLVPARLPDRNEALTHIMSFLDTETPPLVLGNMEALLEHLDWIDKMIPINLIMSSVLVTTEKGRGI